LFAVFIPVQNDALLVANLSTPQSFAGAAVSSAMLDTAITAINVSLALSIAVFLLSFIANKGAAPCCLVVTKWVRCR